jgi:hypothetical protein
MAENCCGMQARSAGIPDIERAALIREAFHLEWFTIAWMTLEPRAGRPNRIERQLGHLPYEMKCDSGAEVEQNRVPDGSTAGLFRGQRAQSEEGAGHW